MITLFTQPFHLNGPYKIYVKSYGPYGPSAPSNTALRNVKLLFILNVDLHKNWRALKTI